MGILDETFNIVSRQKDAIVTKIRCLPQLNESLASVRDNYEHLEALLRTLKIYQDRDNDDKIYPPVILDRISSTEIPTLNTVRERIKQIVCTKEDIESIFKGLAVTPGKTIISNLESNVSVAVMQVAAGITETY